MLQIAIALLIINIFRMPIVATLKLQQYGYISHVLLLIIPLFVKGNLNDFKLPKLSYVLWALLGLTSFIVLYSIGVEKYYLITQVLPFTIPCFFPIIFSTLNIPVERLKEFLTKSAKYIFFIGAIYIILEYSLIHIFKVSSQCQIYEWFFGTKSVQYCQTTRKMPIGFLVYKDISLSLVMGCYFLLDLKSFKQKLLSTLLLILNIVLVDSITLFVVLVILFFAKYYKAIKDNLVVTTIIGLIGVIFLTYTQMFKRLLAYFFSELDLKRFAPTLYDFKTQNFFYTAQGTSEGYHSNELHSLLYFFKYGAMATFGWYLFWLISLILITKELIKTNKISKVLYFNLTFLLAGIHYSGAEAWGINFLFVLVAYVSLETELENSFYQKELLH